MLFPHAALHHTMSSLSGSKAVKHIGQSPEISLRFLEGDEGDDDGDEALAEDIGGARAKIWLSSLRLESGPTKRLREWMAFLLTEERKASWY